MASDLNDLIILLSGAINQRRLYFDSHPKVRSLSQEFTTRLVENLSESGDNGFFFGVLNGKFIRHGKYLIGPSIAGKNLIEFAERLRCGGFMFRKNLEVDEVAAFLQTAADLREPVATLEESFALFKSAGIANIELTPLYRENTAGDALDQPDLAQIDPSLIQFDFSDNDGDDAGGMGASVSENLAPMLPIFQAMYETVANNNMQVHQDHDLDLSPSQAIAEELNSVADQQTMDIMNMMRYPDYDSYTVGHSVRVSTLVLAVGREMGWPEHLLSELATAGLLHDIGKAKVPDEILYKPGRLDREERKIAESHAALGANILLTRGDASPLVIAGAWGHHRHHDGGGYPVMPEWAVKSPITGLIHVCDVFEALTAARPYKQPLPPRRAFEVILRSHTTFEPAALSALIRAIGLYPPGSEIRLTDGCRGYVTAKGPGWEKPTVRVVRDKEGRHLAKEDQYVLKLHEEEDLEVADFLMVGLEPAAAEETAVEIQKASDELDSLFGDVKT